MDASRGLNLEDIHSRWRINLLDFGKVVCRDDAPQAQINRFHDVFPDQDEEGNGLIGNRDLNSPCSPENQNRTESEVNV